MQDNNDDMNKKLQQSEERYRVLVEMSPFCVITLYEGKFAYVNLSGLEVFKVDTLSQLEGKPFSEFVPLENRDKILEIIQNANKPEQPPVLYESKLSCVDGSIFDAEMTIGQITYWNKSMVHIIIRNITEIKHQKLHAAIREAVKKNLVPTKSIVEAVTGILEFICVQLSIEAGLLWIVDNQTRTLRCVSSWQSDNITSTDISIYAQNATLLSGQGMAGAAWDSGSAIWTRDIRSFLTPEADFAAKLGINKAVAYPVFYDNSINIIIELLSNDLDQANQYISIILDSIGNQLSTFLHAKQIEMQLKSIGERDLLTGYYNRSYFENLVSDKISKRQNQAEKIAVLFLDVDNFETVNIAVGYKGGDYVLKNISERIINVLYPTTLISRVQGDKFVIVTFEASMDEVHNLIQKIKGIFISPFVFENAQFNLTVSIGVCIYPDDGGNISTLLKNAEIAMKESKEAYPNGFKFYNAKMSEQANRRLKLEQCLLQAFDKDEFLLFYQPKFDVYNNKIVGVEALLRWQRDDEMIMPAEFINIIESNGQIIKIGEWVLKEACKQAKLWRDSGMNSLLVSVNISASQLKSPSILTAVSNALLGSGLDARNLELEITESVLMQNTHHEFLTLNTLKKMGVKLSLDDFGSGFSSFSYLKKIQVDTLKIDKSFIDDINKPRSEAIVSSILSMAKVLGIFVVAEGVETEEQLSILKKLGCDQIQGYIFARPQDATTVTKLLQDNLLK